MAFVSLSIHSYTRTSSQRRTANHMHETNAVHSLRTSSLIPMNAGHSPHLAGRGDAWAPDDMASDITAVHSFAALDPYSAHTLIYVGMLLRFTSRNAKATGVFFRDTSTPPTNGSYALSAIRVRSLERSIWRTAPHSSRTTRALQPYTP
ncbi:hypothetical protein WOLCODRAFT_157484 [Wolfiporia cocos MD-104 SS10]|uniref:Uncharacterized protein n=1 Tax=Wolfiporia cocos (strain MD-104) TaxID=742152 RepID=A0A2H3JJC0_WOLCO|nr:hypothetical protein WOLCODRAFT_157484 [Wolfiporia cocos MD-104 SS10]